VLAPDVRAGQPEPVAQEVAEQEARLDELTVAPAVDRQLDGEHLVVDAGHAVASRAR
jgi:hypothetical protein